MAVRKGLPGQLAAQDLVAAVALGVILLMRVLVVLALNLLVVGVVAGVRLTDLTLVPVAQVAQASFAFIHGR